MGIKNYCTEKKTMRDVIKKCSDTYWIAEGERLSGNWGKKAGDDFENALFDFFSELRNCRDCDGCNTPSL